ncbi:sodium/potassium/calcium exchanger 3-like isoform X2 [Harmonia axyridis]|uniref:sodium/potassium/calcium exchanger 3-like isoform X2 n=1 Tax=Harmonia axyridis TaxID=115357 RepID=UPI001E2781F4|nr:sodium/potassium/calcium exchanger 3-like isoform X2 [Harmonia axyridis]
MAMLLRTKKTKIVLCVKIFAFLSVTIFYSLLNVFSEDNNGENLRASRHLLATTGQNCTPAAIFDFPPDGFTRQQRQQGWILVHAAIATYLFILLAIVCDDYFVPAIKKFCDSLEMSEDIAGATFMATASSSPELFINCVGTFVTEGDLGVGTIVGSAVFNILAVPACCGLFANMVMDLDWWPITRDSIIYGTAVILLISVLQDGRVYVYEALTLVLFYILYIFIMYFNGSISALATRALRKIKRKRRYTEVLRETEPLLAKNGKTGSKCNIANCVCEADISLKDCEELEESTNIWEWPTEESASGKCWWIFTWPISFILYLTTPDCRKYPRLFVFTFLMCIIWIGITSYVVAWLITVVGDTLNIPDSVMGLTFLAAGTSVPEAVSSVIVTNQGHGAMGISSSIGSNTFDILLCLGIPWFIKTAFYPTYPDRHWIQINSSGITYSAVSLLSTLVLFYGGLYLNKFRLDWKIGLGCLALYGGFLTMASLIELNVFFPVNLPTCDR